MRPESGRVFGLDVMRASAIGLVLLNHTLLWFASFKPVFNISLVAGFFGVELFFVLSGFLIGGILLRALTNESSTITLFGFWQRRWLRTLPNYFLFLGVNTVLAACLFHSTPSTLSYLFFAQNITARPPAFFIESWSLAVEEWFYILLPVLLIVALKLSRKSFRSSSLFLIAAVIVGVTLARSLYVFSANSDWLTGVRMIVVYRLDACMFGVLAAWTKHFAPEKWQYRPRRPFVLGVIVFAIVALLALVLPDDSTLIGSAGFTLTSLAAALLLPTFDRWTSSSAPCSGAIVKTSIWSYSLYLVNLPVFALVFHWLRWTGPVVCATTYLFFSVALAASIYHCYEKPIMDLRDRRSIRRRNFALQHSSSPLLMKN